MTLDNPLVVALRNLSLKTGEGGEARNVIFSQEMYGCDHCSRSISASIKLGVFVGFSESVP
jgi:hypothetical protein